MSFTLINAALIILLFTFYTSTARDIQFKKLPLKMAGISLGVSVPTFAIGYFVRSLIGLEV